MPISLQKHIFLFGWVLDVLDSELSNIRRWEPISGETAASKNDFGIRLRRNITDAAIPYITIECVFGFLVIVDGYLEPIHVANLKFKQVVVVTNAPYMGGVI